MRGTATRSLGSSNTRAAGLRTGGWTSPRGAGFTAVAFAPWLRSDRPGRLRGHAGEGPREPEAAGCQPGPWRPGGLSLFPSRRRFRRRKFCPPGGPPLPLRAKFVRRLTGMLRPGGRLLVGRFSEPDNAGGGRLAQPRRGSADGSHVRNYTPAKMARLRRWRGFVLRKLDQVRESARSIVRAWLQKAGCRGKRPRGCAACSWKRRRRFGADIPPSRRWRTRPSASNGSGSHSSARKPG